MARMATTPAPPPTSTLASELRETLGRLTRRLRAEPGPSVPHLAVIGLLDREGPKSVSDLAHAQRMRPQSMAQNVRELEEAGLVTRRPDPDDGRRAFVELTPAGTASILASRAAREDWLAQTLAGALDARERAALHDALALLDRLARA
jgi:DNA-binding MarR family transcriptional regulator